MEKKKIYEHKKVMVKNSRVLILVSSIIILLLSACSTNKIDGVKNEVDKTTSEVSNTTEEELNTSNNDTDQITSDLVMSDYLPSNNVSNKLLCQPAAEGSNASGLYTGIIYNHDEENQYKVSWDKWVYGLDEITGAKISLLGEPISADNPWSSGYEYYDKVKNELISESEDNAKVYLIANIGESISVVEGETRTLDGQLYNIETSAGTFENCIKIIVEYEISPPTVCNEYYAKGVGLIRTEILDENGEYKLYEDLVEINYLTGSESVKNSDIKNNSGTTDSTSDDWNQVYKAIMENKDNVLPVNEEFGLFDFDNNGIPELIVGGYLEYHIYTIDSNGSAKEVGTISRAELYLDEYNTIIAKCSFGTGSGGIVSYEFTDGEGFLETYVLESEEGIDYTNYTYYGETVDKDAYEEEYNYLMNSAVEIPLNNYDGVDFDSIELSDYILKR